MGPLRNLHVKNCTIRSKSHAIKFGSNTDEEMSNCLFENLTIFDSNGGLSIQQRSQGDIHNVTFRDIVMQTRYEAPRWWGNGEWAVVTAQPRAVGDIIGRTYDIHFENIVAHAENGGFFSGHVHGVQHITVRNVTVYIAAYSNYSTGIRCIRPGNVSIPCMGTRDYRPVDALDCGKVCRTPALAHGLYLENVTHATFDRFRVVFDGHRLPWWGDCVDIDHSSSSDIVFTTPVACINGLSAA
eukprot:m.525047 g.525047  ORF g.525047 m.525047 type:complete len:241 (+) comp21998_c0_seq1:2532-3254(+)